MKITPDVIRMIETDCLSDVQAWVAAHNGFGARDDNGETLLHKAAFYGARHVAQWLLENGMSANVRDKQDYTPLHEAARAGNPAVISLLLERGGDLDVTTRNGKRPLECAIEKGDQETITLLRNAYRAPRWLKTGDAEVAEVSYRDEIRYKVTQIFNFAARSYILVMQNERTQAESVTMRTFGELADRQMIQTAEKAFIDLGGKLPESYGYLALEKPAPRGIKKSSLGPQG